MPSYTKNYYHILGLDAPVYASNEIHVSLADLKRGYRQALLAAHPDKNGVRKEGGRDGERGSKRGGYTVDDVKEAWSVLGDEERRGEYDGWFVRSGRMGGGMVEKDGGRGGEADADFVLGLEVLDLGDFEEVTRSTSSPSTTSPPRSSSSSSSGSTSSDQAEQEERGEEIYWTRPCRCGAQRGFSIEERDLETALERGEQEVLVGCEGCSLWVRVGFGVEEG